MPPSARPRNDPPPAAPPPSGRSRPSALVVAGLVAFAVAAVLLVRVVPPPSPPDTPTPALPTATFTPLPPPPTLAPAQSTVAAEAAARSLGQVGGSAGVAVGAPGAFLAPAPTGTVALVRAPGATPAPAAAAATDALRGVAVVALPVPTETGVAGGLELADVSLLREGQELVLAPGDGRPPIKVTYLGIARVPLPNLPGFEQELLDVLLSSGSSVRDGVLLDGNGRIVGIIQPDRQRSAPPGHAYVTGADAVRDLLERSGVVPTFTATVTPTSTGTPTPNPSE